MTDAINGPEMPVSAVEVQEVLNAEYVVRLLESETGAVSIAKELRTVLRLHRFTVMVWLLQNGVSIPPGLLSDQAHPLVGNQFPDRSVQRD